MRIRILWPWLVAGLVAILVAAAPVATRAAGPTAPAVTGKVSSASEGAMEGVLVTASTLSSPITVTVVSDHDGRYRFPADRLKPSKYFLAIRAVGYDLDGDGAVLVAAGKTATADLKLVPAQNLEAQLTAAEWMNSVPGTDDQKGSLNGCVGCHTVERVLRSTHTADEFTQLMWRMAGYAFVSQPMKPQRRVDAARAGQPENYRAGATYLASVNLGAQPNWAFPLKTLPRPTGRATHVVVTEYNLPRRIIQPHDVIVDEHGTIWYTNFGEQYFGRVDAGTGAHKEWPIPILKPGQPEGTLDLREDGDGNMWIALMHQGALAKFNPRTEKFRIYKIPAEWQNDNSQIAMVTPPKRGSRTMWAQDQGSNDVYRVNIATGHFERFQVLKGLPGGPRRALYGFATDSHDNIYFTEFLSNLIGRLDAKTGAVKFYETPTKNSRPRRMEMDAQDRLWIAEFNTSNIAMLDTKTETVTEYPTGVPWFDAYDAIADKNGEIWASGMTTDRVVRLDPKTGQSVAYLMPLDTNVRRVFVDNKRGHTSFWAGSNHGAAIVHVEPLD